MPHFDINVPGAVPGIRQPSSMSCWATVTTMMMSWRDSTSYAIAEAMDAIGAVYRTKFDNDQGLSGSDKPKFLVAAGFVAEAPMSFSVAGFRSLLEFNGPLWVTTDEDPTAGFAIHARIATGMSGDGTVDNTFLRIVDPADGGQHQESFRLFMRKFEEEAATGQPLRVQVVHFPAGVGPGGAR